MRHLYIAYLVRNEMQSVQSTGSIIFGITTNRGYPAFYKRLVYRSYNLRWATGAFWPRCHKLAVDPCGVRRGVELPAGGRRETAVLARARGRLRASVCRLPLLIASLPSPSSADALIFSSRVVFRRSAHAFCWWAGVAVVVSGIAPGTSSALGGWTPESSSGCRGAPWTRPRGSMCEVALLLF